MLLMTTHPRPTRSDKIQPAREVSAYSRGWGGTGLGWTHILGGALAAGVGRFDDLAQVGRTKFAEGGECLCARQEALANVRLKELGLGHERVAHGRQSGRLVVR